MKIFKKVNNTNKDFDIHQLQLDINAIYNWSQDMKLPLNLDKSKYMIYNPCYSNSNKQNYGALYKIGPSTLGSVSIYKDLGISFENNLSFDSHVKNIILTANHTNACLRKCFNLSLKSIRILLFNCFVRPHFDYRSTIWVAKNKTMNNRIEKVLKNFTRHLDFNTYQSYECRLIKLQQISLANRKILLDCCFMYKVFNNYFPNINLDVLGLAQLNSTRHKLNLKERFLHQRRFSMEYTRRIVST